MTKVETLQHLFHRQNKINLQHQSINSSDVSYYNKSLLAYRWNYAMTMFSTRANFDACYCKLLVTSQLTERTLAVIGAKVHSDDDCSSLLYCRQFQVDIRKP